MNFSNHIKKQRKELRESLEGNKAEIISKLLVCVRNAEGLLGGQYFRFWQDQMQEIEINEIAMTYYGLKTAKYDLSRSEASQADTRNVLESEVLSTCVTVLVYSNEDDQCYMQTEFRYFFDEATNQIIKESDTGIQVNLEGIEISEVHYDRIAKVSDLNIDKSEWVL